MNIQKLLRKNIRTLKAYSAREVPCRVKLDANESPYSFPSLLESVKIIPTNRYPDPEGKTLKSRAARRWKVKSEQILLGNGSDELIYYLITTFGGPVLFPTPTFSMYGIIAQSLGEEVIGVPLDENFDLDVRSMIAAIKGRRPKIIFLSTPNNPTGNRFLYERILKIIKASRGIVVIDEAYQPFSNQKNMPLLIDKHKNVSIMRTMSKIGFASLRVGFLLGNTELIEAVNRVRLPFNLNSFSQLIASEALRNYGEIKKTLDVLKRERRRLFTEMKRIDGVTPYPSDANFILFRVHDSASVFRGLLAEGVLIREMGDAVKDCLRVTVGTPEENSLFLEALRKVLT
jgi:histidinol-phosphate aminotransferase